LQQSLIISPSDATLFEKPLQSLLTILGPAKIVSIDHLNLLKDNSWSIVFCVSQANELDKSIQFIQSHPDLSKHTLIALVVTGQFEQTDQFLWKVRDLIPFVDLKCLILQPDYSQQEQVFAITNFALEMHLSKDHLEDKMDPETLRPYIDDFLLTHNTCALSTWYQDKVTSRPIEYHYSAGELHMVSEGGVKFAGILVNGQVAVSIFDPYQGFSCLAGMQITGKAIVPPLGSLEYQRSITICGLSMERMQRLPVPLNAIIIYPQEAIYLWSGFSKLGLKARQIYHFANFFLEKP
jgi:Pyridoxamine 5'-phosphate oxidase